MKKRPLIYVLAALLSMISFKADAYLQSLSPQSFEALYNLAARGNVSAINNARSRGMNVDSVNSNGNSGLCEAAIRGNARAFKSFLQAGASPYHPCTQNIKGFQNFMQAVIKTPVTNLDTAVFGAGAGQSIGVGTATLIGAGVVAAGAGVALAVGGGGGGGSDKGSAACTQFKGEDGKCYEILDCQNGSVQKNGSCDCTLAPGYIGKLCDMERPCEGYTEVCARGYEPTEETCKSGPKTMYKCQMKACEGYEVWCEKGYTPDVMHPCYRGNLETYICVANTCDGFSLETCPTGYEITAECDTPTDHYVKCDACSEGYDYYDTDECHETLDCQNGSTQKGNHCECVEHSGWTGTLCNVPAVCEGYETECGQGWDEDTSIEPCYSAGEAFIKCKKHVCEGNPQPECVAPTAISGEPCFSGDEELYYCDACVEGYRHWGDVGDNTCYETLDCQNGFTQRGDHCECDESSGWTGTLCNEKVNCAAKGFYATCPGQGWHVVEGEGKTCMSGYDVWVTCEKNDCSSAYSECIFPRAEGEACYSGDDVYNYCNNCATGYDFYGTTECHKTIACVHGEQKGGQCECEDGWWGTLCDAPRSCPDDGYNVQGSTCPEGTSTDSPPCGAFGKNWLKCNVCDESAGYYHFDDPNACYKELGCVHGVQKGGKCECDHGWNDDGLCEAQQVCIGWPYTTCPGNTAPAAGESVCVDTLDDGTSITYYKCLGCKDGYAKWGGPGDDTCYETLDCGERGHQEGAACVCNEGWISDGGWCNVKNTCSAIYQESCGDAADGYEIDPTQDSCWSGDDELYICRAVNCVEKGYTHQDGCPTAGFNDDKCKSGTTYYYKCTDCDEAAGYGHYGDLENCYQTLECKHGSSQEKDRCNCLDETGWSGTTCDKCTGAIGDGGERCYHDRLCVHGTLVNNVCTCTGNWTGETCAICEGKEVGDECVLDMECEFGCKTRDATTGLCTECYSSAQPADCSLDRNKCVKECWEAAHGEIKECTYGCKSGYQDEECGYCFQCATSPQPHTQYFVLQSEDEPIENQNQNLTVDGNTMRGGIYSRQQAVVNGGDITITDASGDYGIVSTNAAPPKDTSGWNHLSDWFALHKGSDDIYNSGTITVTGHKSYGIWSSTLGEIDNDVLLYAKEIINNGTINMAGRSNTGITLQGDGHIINDMNAEINMNVDIQYNPNDPLVYYDDSYAIYAGKKNQLIESTGETDVYRYPYTIGGTYDVANKIVNSGNINVDVAYTQMNFANTGYNDQGASAIRVERNDYANEIINNGDINIGLTSGPLAEDIGYWIPGGYGIYLDGKTGDHVTNNGNIIIGQTDAETNIHAGGYIAGVRLKKSAILDNYGTINVFGYGIWDEGDGSVINLYNGSRVEGLSEGNGIVKRYRAAAGANYPIERTIDSAILLSGKNTTLNIFEGAVVDGDIYNNNSTEYPKIIYNAGEIYGNIRSDYDTSKPKCYSGPIDLSFENASTGKIMGNVLATEIENYGIIDGNATARNPSPHQVSGDWNIKDRIMNYTGAKITGNAVGLKYNAGEVRGAVTSLVLENTSTGIIKGGISGTVWNETQWYATSMSSGWIIKPSDARGTRVENYGLIEGNITSVKHTWTDASGNEHEQKTVRPIIYNRNEIKGGDIKASIINETQIETITWADETQTINTSEAKLSGNLSYMGALVNYGGTIDYEVNSTTLQRGLGVDFLYNPKAITISSGEVCYDEGGQEGLKTVTTPDGEINIHVIQLKVDTGYNGALYLTDQSFMPEGQAYTPFQTYHNIPNETSTYTYQKYDSNIKEWVTETRTVCYSVNEGAINVTSDTTTPLNGIYGNLYNKGTIEVTGANITGIRSDHFINEGVFTVTGENATGFNFVTNEKNTTYKAMLNKGSITVNSGENDSSSSAVRGIYVTGDGNLDFNPYSSYNHEIHVSATNGKAYGVYDSGGSGLVRAKSVYVSSNNNDAYGLYVTGGNAALIDAYVDSNNAAAYGVYATNGATVSTNKIYAHSETSSKLGIGVYLSGGSTLNNGGEIVSNGSGSSGSILSAGVYADASIVNNIYTSNYNHGEISGKVGVYAINGSTVNNDSEIYGAAVCTAIKLKASTLNNHGTIGKQVELYAVDAENGSVVNNYKGIAGTIRLEGSTLNNNISNGSVSSVVASEKSYVNNIAGTIDNVNIDDSTIDNNGNITGLIIDHAHGTGSSSVGGTNAGTISTLTLKDATFENSGSITTAHLQYGNGNGKLTNLAGGVIRKIDASTGTLHHASTIINQGMIAPADKITQSYDYMITAAAGTTVTNEGTIKTQKSGVYLDASTFINTSTGVVLNDKVTEAQAATNDYWLIYATNGSTVINQGTLQFKDNQCEGADCNPANPDMEGKHYIYLEGGSTFSNGGKMASAAPLNTNSLGGGKMLLAKGGSYEAPAIEGEIGVDTSVVEEGFEETYTLTNAIISEDTSALAINSQSALFDASLEGQDVILTKKGFDEITDNATVAAFLEDNYALNNNEALYGTLKAQTNTQALTSAVEDLTGDGLKRFAFEDMTMLKDMDMDVNNALFDNTKTEFSLAGDTHPLNAGKNNSSNARWSLTGKKEDDRSYGVTMAFVSMRSQDDHNKNSRHDEMFIMGMPFGVEKWGAEFAVTPRLGYAYGKYTRDGLNGSYDGKMEKRIMGVTSEARYPLYMDGWKVSPSVSFNAIGYHIKGHEEDKAYALNIDKQNIASMEAGIGFGLEKNWKLKKETNLKFALNVMVYHEFLDPYALKLSMRDMAGSYEIRDEKRRREHVVVKNKFEYDMNPVSVYGNLFTHIDSEYSTKAEVGLKYAF